MYYQSTPPLRSQYTYRTRNAPVQRECAQCGKAFTARPSRVAAGFGLYCSKPCSNAARAKPMEERAWALVDKTTTPDGCWLSLCAKDKDGYGLFALLPRGQEAHHRTIYKLVNGDIPSTTKVLHHCDNPPCCRPEHLFTGSDADNIADKVAKGRQSRGSTHGTAKLTEAAVRDIRQRVSSKETTQIALAAEYHVEPATINGIVRGRNWKHLLST